MTHRENTHPGKLFRLVRDEDNTGISGTGHVASGVEWPDGSVSLKWHTKGSHVASIGHYPSVANMLDIHGHKSTAYPYRNTTKVVYTDKNEPSTAVQLARELGNFTYDLGALLEKAEKGVPLGVSVDYVRGAFGKLLDLAQVAKQ